MKIPFWMGIGAASKTADGRKDRRSFIVGGAIAVLAVAGLVLIFVSKLHF